MKKLKFLTLAAIAAATAMVSSCSDNGDLSTPTKEAEGKALVVNPTVDGSRIVTTASDDFTSFKLFGFQNPPSTQPLFFNGTDGYVYNGAIGSAWSPTATGAKWPANSDTNSSNFYALSVNGGSSLPSYSGIDLTNIQQGKFSYTAPLSGSDVDLSKQEDILVASSLNALQTDNGGVLNLPFTHAFAKLTMQMRFNSYENGATTGDLKDKYHYTIKSIAIRNIKLNGEFSYADGWTPSDMGDIVFNFDNGIDLEAQHLEGAPTDKIYRDLIGQASSIMIVPQTFTKFWVTTDENPKTLASLDTQPYVDILGWVWNETKTILGLKQDLDFTDEEANYFVSNYNPAMFDPNDDTVEVYNGCYGVDLSGCFSYIIDDNTEAEHVYFPFPSALTSFVANKEYNIRLNIYKGVYSTGLIAIHGAGQV